MEAEILLLGNHKLGSNNSAEWRGLLGPSFTRLPRGYKGENRRGNGRPVEKRTDLASTNAATRTFTWQALQTAGQWDDVEARNCATEWPCTLFIYYMLKDEGFFKWYASECEAVRFSLNPAQGQRLQERLSGGIRPTWTTSFHEAEFEWQDDDFQKWYSCNKEAPFEGSITYNYPDADVLI